MNPQPDDRDHLATNVLFDDWHGKEIRPKYKVGDILYLKEPYIDDLSMEKVFYKFSKSNKEEVERLLNSAYGKMAHPNPWKNKLFMPRSAARYFIKITDVRMERLQDITEEDCIKEGVEMNNTPYEGWYWMEDYYSTDNPIVAYQRLIDKINGKGTWDSNPFVFVYDYELMPF